ncbi:hypothetical protein NC652_021416 [Populus alba x Populus x berolinensis]|nr:hypothetical protein NC652_021416 [Populus alba x Populus x berolinensis]
MRGELYLVLLLCSFRCSLAAEISR